MIAAATCPTCGHDTADVELLQEGLYVVANVYTCRLCSNSWYEDMKGNDHVDSGV